MVLNVAKLSSIDVTDFYAYLYTLTNMNGMYVGKNVNQFDPVKLRIFYVANWNNEKYSDYLNSTHRAIDRDTLVWLSYLKWSQVPRRLDGV